MNSLPTLTHLQFLVIDCLGAQEVTGRELRERLAKQGTELSGPAFYQMMSRLEESKLVEGWYNQKTLEGQVIRERQYRLTGDGVEAFNATLRFYNRQKPARRWLPGLKPA
jgi:DNA-binding PadR family transcriptional regulator